MAEDKELGLIALHGTRVERVCMLQCPDTTYRQTAAEINRYPYPRTRWPFIETRPGWQVCFDRFRLQMLNTNRRQTIFLLFLFISLLLYINSGNICMGGMFLLVGVSSQTWKLQ